ncbi:hypothetical protein C2S51_015782 [Perilla frutescens var. frutescens]|nr:hypothetical protein C2S51_015782 [Perilla frutescens var. frutescens]
MKNGEGVFIPLEDDVFGSNCEIYIHLEDIIPFCDLDPISGNCMVVYVWHLYKKMKAESTLSGFRFVNPFTISHMAKTSLSARTQALGDRLIGVCPNQLVVVPSNVGLHWILTVIDPNKEIVYLLDPLGNRIRKNVVDRSITLFNANLGKKGRKQPVWEILKAPRQPDSKQCGFYVMRYMKEIIENGSISKQFRKESYSMKEIDEVRVEWANCVLDYV